MSDNILIFKIRHTRELNAIWNRLSPAGKRRVLELCDGDDLMLKENLEDVLAEEKDNG